jgi:hypothetical protein
MNDMMSVSFFEKNKNPAEPLINYNLLNPFVIRFTLAAVDI